MVKVMRLSVNYDGYYGGSVDEYALLPLDVNGVLFEKLEEGYYGREVYLGEIEGKHSEVYGDLQVEFIELDELLVKDVSELIKGSYIGEFECYLEGKECDYLDEDEFNEKADELLKVYGIENKPWMIVSVAIHDKFIEQLKSKYDTKFSTITVLESDLNKVNNLLKENGISTF